jgi:hypothetical protein
MHRSGRLTLIKSTLSAVLVHTTICLELPAWVCKALIKIMRGFLWTGTEAVHGAKCVVAWNQVQCPLSIGGLGIPDLDQMGMALQFRWLWKQKQGGDSALQLHHCENPATMSFFHSSLQCFVRNGASTLFWLDPWIDGQGIAERASELLAIVDKRKQGSRMVQVTLHNNAWIRDITGAVKIPAIVQYLHPRERIDQVVLQPDVADTVAWRCSSSGVYSASSAYAALLHGQTSLFGAKEVWKTRAPMEHKFFLWLVLQDRCWTSESLQRHGLDKNGPCAFCVQSPELIDHLLLYCIFSREVWFKVLRHFGWQGLASALEEKLAK